MNGIHTMRSKLRRLGHTVSCGDTGSTEKPAAIHLCECTPDRNE